ncbi:MAG: hypothetical protein ABSG54_18080 [Terriglobia bacterium]
MRFRREPDHHNPPVTPQGKLQHVPEVRVPGYEDGFVLLGEGEDSSIRGAALPQLDNMFRGVTLLPKEMAEGKRQVFVNQEARH